MSIIKRFYNWLRQDRCQDFTKPVSHDMTLKRSFHGKKSLPPATRQANTCVVEEYDNEPFRVMSCGEPAPSCAMMASTVFAWPENDRSV